MNHSTRALLLLPLTLALTTTGPTDHEAASDSRTWRVMDVIVQPFAVTPLAAQILEDPCRNCAESMIQPDPEEPPQPVHYWTGTWPCDIKPAGPSCRVCEGTHCNNPEVAHGGSCPTDACDSGGGGGGGHLAAAVRMLADRDVAWFARQVESDPTRFGFDAGRGAYQIYDCQGRVIMHWPVALLTAGIDAAGPTYPANRDLRRRGLMGG
jgi:hypothetical protein